MRRQPSTHELAQSDPLPDPFQGLSDAFRALGKAVSLAALLVLAAAGGPAMMAPSAAHGALQQASASASVEIVQAARISFAAMDAADASSPVTSNIYQRRSDGVRIRFEFN